MEGSSTFLADQSSAYSLDDVIAVGFDADDSSKLDSQFMKNGIQGRGLGGGAGESVEDPSLLQSPWASLSFTMPTVTLSGTRAPLSI